MFFLVGLEAGDSHTCLGKQEASPLTMCKSQKWKIMRGNAAVILKYTPRQLETDFWSNISVFNMSGLILTQQNVFG